MPRARASEGALRQALDVLLENALRHGAGTVRLAAYRQGHVVRVTVADEGEGIPPDAADRIFERRVSFGAGSGLGLSLARELLRAEGGTLELARAAPPEFAIVLRAASPARA